MNVAPWTQIQDLPENWAEMASQELKSLADIWKEQSQRLQASNSFSRFSHTLGREWSVESDVLENLYKVDRTTTQRLIEQGLEASLIPDRPQAQPTTAIASPPREDRLVAILKSQQGALDNLFNFFAQHHRLNLPFIRQLHCQFTYQQSSAVILENLRMTEAGITGERKEVLMQPGQWKSYPSPPRYNQGGFFQSAPPELVQEEMERLIVLHNAHETMGVPPEVEAAWLHHRFCQIQPFQDGNGRVARAIATYVFLRAKWFPLVIQPENHQQYIECLEAADNGNLMPLVTLFGQIQRKAFIKALSLSHRVLTARTPGETTEKPLNRVIASISDRFRARHIQQVQEKERVIEHTKTLENLALEQFKEIAFTLDNELKQFDPHYFSIYAQSTEKNDYWYKKEIYETARKLDYFADTQSYRSWVRLKIKEDRQVEIVLSFHSLGVEFLGVMVASPFILFRDKTEDSDTTVDGPYPLTTNVFQYSYTEDLEKITARFTPWLEESLLKGLELWRDQL